MEEISVDYVNLFDNKRADDNSQTRSASISIGTGWPDRKVVNYLGMKLVEFNGKMKPLEEYVFKQEKL